MKHLVKVLQEMEQESFTVATSRGVLALQQTQRNDSKAKILEAFFQDMKEELGEAGFEVYMTSYGPVIEVYNEKVETDVYQKEYELWKKQGNKGRMADFISAKRDVLPSGRITIQSDWIMKNLDVNATIDQASYIMEKEQKVIREKEKEIKKRKKIERDAEMRAEKQRKREEAVAKIERANSEK
jgi:hypothetical protein